MRGDTIRRRGADPLAITDEPSCGPADLLVRRRTSARPGAHARLHDAPVGVTRYRADGLMARRMLGAPPVLDRVRRAIFGAPKDVKDPHAFHQLSLVALLAWVGLGADGLSSSAYGPEEAFKQLGEHQGLAILLALATAVTVFIISYAYSRVIEHFPSGGGGYVVATKLLGRNWGVLSGCALLVDYVLTITVSIASGADAVFSLLPASWAPAKMPVELGGLLVLTIMNIRGVKESVTALVPIFMTFVVTHAVLLVSILGRHVTEIPAVSREVGTSISHTVASLGMLGTLKLFVRAYSLGGGTYTGIEAVSNGVGIMREPRVKTAKRTMVMMALSLAITAGGILLCYLLVHVEPDPNKTMNTVLFERFADSFTLGGLRVGHGFVWISLLSEGALLFVAAQTGFVDGPRVMANMAIDSWLPHRFSALSERLSMRNGVILMGGASVAALLYTHGDVGRLVVMYSINVFLTFSLSEFGMSKFWIQHRKEHAKEWKRHLPVHLTGLTLCLTILAVTLAEKFSEGGWLTLVITGLCFGLCQLINRHYNLVVRAIRALDHDFPAPEDVDGSVEATLAKLPERYRSMAVDREEGAGAPSAEHPVAILFVGGYGGLGRHALFTLLRMFKRHFRGVVFVSVAVVDSDVFKGGEEVEALEARTRQSLERYERFGRSLGLATASAFSVGTEVAVEAEKLGTELFRKYPEGLVVAGQLIFEEDTLWNRALHNETAFLIQQRLQRVGVPMVVLPVRLDLKRVLTAAPAAAAAA
jgi:amino acid transporter